MHLIYSREIYLNGNNLEAEGTIELVKLAADHAEMESYERAETARLKAEEEAQALLMGSLKTLDTIDNYSK